MDCESLQLFMETTISKYGGYGKCCGSPPDVMHSYMGLAALSISHSKGLPVFESALGVSKRATMFGKALGGCLSPIFIDCYEEKI